MAVEPVVFPKRMLQRCPLCAEPQPVYLKGHVFDPQDCRQLHVSHDMGYSFCNCRNIWFTKRENLQDGYDDDYEKKYAGASPFLEAYADKYFPVLKYLKSDIKTFIEVGCINPALLNKAKSEGWETLALDIQPRSFEGHKTIVADFEKAELKKDFDVVWASHVFEHFLNPIAAARGLADAVKPDGLLFIAMPDPFQIDWNNYLSWGHWHVREHHTLWDMGSFIELMEENGLKIKYAYRNVTAGKFICTGDYHLIFRKP